MNIDLKDMSTQALAYLGDCVLELLVREHLVESGISTSKGLNQEALRFVCAPAQAEAMKNILPRLTDEEEAYFKRGRNIGHTNTPKHATVAQYRTATGMEALFGYLHITEQHARAKELFRIGYGEK